MVVAWLKIFVPFCDSLLFLYSAIFGRGDGHLRYVRTYHED
jgi:hypothetical protein